MAFTTTIDNATDLQREFKLLDRYHYSYQAYQAMIDLTDECYLDGLELDVIGMCCDFDEDKLETVLKAYDLDSLEELQDRTIVYVTDNTEGQETVLYRVF